MKMTIYTITYNEEFMLPFFIRWYRERFPDCEIVIYDNESTDKTQDIAIANKCQIISYNTNNQLSDNKYLQIKNHCWKNSKTDWVLICDVDEFLEINPNMLNTNQTLFKSKGYNICNVDNLTNINDIKHGIEAVQYDKVLCFNKSYIKEINYNHGCHTCNPVGDVVYSQNRPNLFHMKFINENLLVEKYKNYASRLSKENIKYNWGFHYRKDETSIRDNFKNHLKSAKIIR
jgi:glycosyltransferase involved in cell wall biosynthesis